MSISGVDKNMKKNGTSNSKKAGANKQKSKIIWNEADAKSNGYGNQVNVKLLKKLLYTITDAIDFEEEDREQIREMIKYLSYIKKE